INNDNQVFFSKDWRTGIFITLGESEVDMRSESLNYCGYPNGSLYIYQTYDNKILYELNDETFKIKNKITSPSAIINVLQAKNGTLIVSTANGLLRQPINEEPQIILSNLSQNGLPPGAILTAYKDEDENLWIGTAGNGFSVTNKYFNFHQLINFPVANDRIQSICFNHKDLYLTSLSGLYKIKNFSLFDTTKNIEPVIINKNITAVTCDLNENTWVSGYHGGIIVLDKNDKIVKEFSLPGSNKDVSIIKMFTSSNGSIFICTSYGLYIKKPGENDFIIFNSDSPYKLLGHYILGVYEDYDNNFWISNNNGLNVISSDFKPMFSFKSSDDKSSFLKRTIITCVTQDLDSAYWIGTLRNGLYRFKNNIVNHYTHANGLASDVVYNVVCDKKNRIWISTSSGLNVFKRKQNNFNNLSEFEGVPNASFSFAGVLKFGEHILYGTSEGLLICNADKVELRNTDIDAYISDVKINGQSTTSFNQNFSIMADNKLISFELAYKPALLSGNIIYQYRIKDLNEEWIRLPPGVNNISFSGLPYKKLQIQVRAAGSINKLDDANIYTLDINSKPPIYKTGIFLGVIVLLFILLALLTFLFFNKRKYKKQLQIIEVERKLQLERTRIGRDLHDNMGAYTSALLAGLNRIESKEEKEKKLLTDLKIYGASIMGFLRETIWMLNAEKLTITSFADRFKNYALRICKNYSPIEIQFEEEIDNDKTLPPTTMLNLFRILQEALQNACKHSQASKINISILSNEKLIFKVEDNGIGFLEQKLNDNYGLDNMRQRAAEAGFSLTLKSNNKGTTVIVTENTANS
ncbi:MAG: two-component regulator propeller domain-containing protein, partial [Ferruginibacter sp.]